MALSTVQAAWPGNLSAAAVPFAEALIDVADAQGSHVLFTTYQTGTNVGAAHNTRVDCHLLKPGNSRVALQPTSARNTPPATVQSRSATRGVADPLTVGGIGSALR